MAYETLGFTAASSALAARLGDRQAAIATLVTDLAATQTALTAAIASEPATTTVAANIATLVADGATPTQGHVNTLNTNWATFLTAYNTLKTNVGTVNTDLGVNTTELTAIAAITNDVILSFKTSLTTNQRRDALRALLAQLEGIV